MIDSTVCLEQVQDEVSAMQRQEETVYGRPGPNEKSPYRPFMVQWMLTVHDTFQLSPVVVPTALYYLDQTPCGSSPLDYQLCGLTALHLAVKVHETRIFQLRQLLALGNVCFTERDVIAMERRILQGCRWLLHPPCPEAYLFVFGKLFYSSAPQIPSSAFAILRQGMKIPVQGKPSIIAYASILAAMEQSYISVETKQALCLSILKVSGLSAASQGLSEAYNTLMLPVQLCSSPTTTNYQPHGQQYHPYQQQQQQQTPVTPPLVQTVTPDTCNVDKESTSNPLQAQESRDEGEYREVITCDEESIEVTFCGKPSMDLLDAMSPRNVDFDNPLAH